MSRFTRWFSCLGLPDGFGERAKRLGVLGLATLLATAVSCGDAGSPTNPGEPHAPVRLTMSKAPGNNGDLQTDTVLSSMAPLEVLVLANDVPASGVSVTWKVSFDTISTTMSTITDHSGIATLQFALGAEAGAYKAQATLDSGATDSAVVFNLTATPGRAARIRLVSGADQTDTATARLQADYVVQVSDAHGNGVGGVAISWAVSTGGGSVSPLSSATATDGQARATHTLGRTAGPNAVIAMAAGVDGGVSFNATATAAHPAQLTLVSGDHQSGEVSHPLGADDVVRTSDSYGNAAAGVAIDWSITVGSGSLSAPTTVSAGDGSAEVRLTLGAAPGAQTLTATAKGLPNAPQVAFTAVATATASSPPPPPPPGPPTTLLLVAGNGQTVPPGGTLPTPITVQVLSASSQPVAGQTITFAVTSGGGSVAPASGTTNSQGVVTTIWTAGSSPGVQTMTASASFTAGVLTVNTIVGTGVVVLWGDPTDNARSGSVGLGQHNTASVGILGVAHLSSDLTITLSHNGASHTSVPATVVIPAGSAFIDFEIAGTSVGTDALIAAAQGYTPATFLTTVDSGTIDLGFAPTTMHMGDSAQVFLHADGPDRATNFVSSPTTFTLTASPNLKFISGGVASATLTSVTLSGELSYATFWLKAIGSGAGSVSISSPTYHTLNTAITITP